MVEFLKKLPVTKALYNPYSPRYIAKADPSASSQSERASLISDELQFITRTFSVLVSVPLLILVHDSSCCLYANV